MAGSTFEQKCAECGAVLGCQSYYISGRRGPLCGKCCSPDEQWEATKKQILDAYKPKPPEPTWEEERIEELEAEVKQLQAKIDAKKEPVPA